MVAGARDAMVRYLALAKEHAAKVSDADSRKWLEDDLATMT